MGSVSRKPKRGRSDSSSAVPPMRKSARLAAIAASATPTAKTSSSQRRPEKKAAASASQRRRRERAAKEQAEFIEWVKAERDAIFAAEEERRRTYNEAYPFVYKPGGGAKKDNAEPTDEEMKPFIMPILKNIKTSNLTLDYVVDKLGTYFGCDLTHRLGEIGELVVGVIKSYPPNFRWGDGFCCYI